jgi:hypothetical protein
MSKQILTRFICRNSPSNLDINQFSTLITHINEYIIILSDLLQFMLLFRVLFGVSFFYEILLSGK